MVVVVVVVVVVAEAVVRHRCHHPSVPLLADVARGMNQMDGGVGLALCLWALVIHC